MARVLSIVPAAALATSCAAAPHSASEVQVDLPLTGDIVPAHDPVLIREGNTYYSYSTGMRGRMPLLARASGNLISWHPIEGPLAAIPGWAHDMVPRARDAWAPDISKVDGRYRLYYAVSSFGSRNSVIGLATSRTLDPGSPEYGWHDDGLVIASSDAVDYNAIDPNFFADSDGRQWLTFGSFWSGIKLVELDPASGKPKAGAELHSLARRGADHGYAIEAPFLVHHDGWYYLIVSFDHCCRGAKSDYKLAIGRSRSVSGPYVDRSGTPMLDGGGSILLEARDGDRFRGTGPAGAGREYLIYHAYDSADEGARTLRLSRITWDATNWPVIGGEREAER